MRAGLGDDDAAVGVTHEDGRTVLPDEDLPGCRDVAVQRHGRF